ncbi:peptide-methionine (S)-S-oxide reductase MsrA [Paenibacillus sp. SAF-054]|uniref:peptide-methionine (S)-S-oxide reductase MsrA n=1 Tax=unclassified Paenibacillus TaxID=185978 RepID=UPI003F800F2A
MSRADEATAVLAMGCFWSPEALFGSMPGVLRTRTGYAGGTLVNPTYRRMGDHSESVELVYEPEILPYEQILRVFWDHHNPVNINGYKGRQYQSLLLYRSSEQKEAIDRVLEERRESGRGEPATEVHPLTTFHPAEEKHQKYYLKRHPDAVAKLLTLYPSRADMDESMLAARLNGLAKGYANRSAVIEEVMEWPLPQAERERIMTLVKAIRW